MNKVGRRGIVLVVLAISVTILVFAFPSPSAALPQYATATGQPCSTCHVNPAGGGALTAVGQAFAAIPTHTTDPAAAFAQVSRPAAATATPAAAPTAARTTTTATTTTTTSAAAPSPAAAAGAAATLPKTGEPNWSAIVGMLAFLLLFGGVILRRHSRAQR